MAEPRQTISEPKPKPDVTSMAQGKDSLTDTAYLKDWILDCKEEAERATKSLRDKWDELWQIYQNRQDYSGKESWQSQTCIPKLFMAVERASLLIERATLQTSKLFDIELDDEFVLPLKTKIRKAKKDVALSQKKSAELLKSASEMLADLRTQQPTPQAVAAIELSQSQIEQADAAVQAGRKKLEELQEELAEYEQQADDDDARFKAHIKKTNFASAFGEAMKCACLLGLGACKRLYNGARKRLSYENTDVQNLHIAPDYQPFQDTNPRYIIEYKEIDLASLIEIAKEANKEADGGNKQAEKVFDMAEIDKITETFQQQSEREDRAERREMDSYTPVSKKVGILEFWGDVVSEDGKHVEKNRLMWLANEKYLIRNHEGPYKDGRHAWDFIVPMVYPHRGVAGISMVHAEVKLQYTLNNLLNLFIDNLTFSVNKMFEYAPQDLMEPEKMYSVFPGKLIKLKPGVQGPAVRVVEAQSIGADAFRVFETVTRELQENTAITEFLTAMPGQKGKTLGEIEIKTSESHGYFDVIARKIEANSIAAILRHSYEMLEQFRDDFQYCDRYQFSVGGLSLLLLRKEMVEYLMQALVLAMKNPQLAMRTKIEDLWRRLLSIWSLDEAYSEEPQEGPSPQPQAQPRPMLPSPVQPMAQPAAPMPVPMQAVA